VPTNFGAESVHSAVALKQRGANAQVLPTSQGFCGTPGIEVKRLRDLSAREGSEDKKPGVKGC